MKLIIPKELTLSSASSQSWTDWSYMNIVHDMRLMWVESKVVWGNVEVIDWEVIESIFDLQKTVLLVNDWGDTDELPFVLKVPESNLGDNVPAWITNATYEDQSWTQNNTWNTRRPNWNIIIHESFWYFACNPLWKYIPWSEIKILYDLSYEILTGQEFKVFREENIDTGTGL